MSALPAPSDDILERAFCKREVIDEAWRGAGALSADAVGIEEKERDPGRHAFPRP